jgi:hypothetical protein
MTSPPSRAEYFNAYIVETTFIDFVAARNSAQLTVWQPLLVFAMLGQ